jgi:ATP-binding protein involved in chromosome partitioning
MGFLTDDDSPVIWRGPMLHGAIQQFFRDVRWTDVDYLIVDLPPGTGDIALSLSQSVPVAGAVVVTTPQSVALADTRRAVHMYRKLNIPVLGLLENMSYFACAGCGRESDLFGRGGAEKLASDLSVAFLGAVPLQERVRTGGDTGVPIVLGEPDSAPSRALIAAAERVAQQVSIASFSRRVLPLQPV